MVEFCENTTAKLKTVERGYLGLGQIRVQISALPCINCVTLGPLLNLIKIQFPPMQNWDKNSSFLIGLWWGLNEILPGSTWHNKCSINVNNSFT